MLHFIQVYSWKKLAKYFMKHCSCIYMYIKVWKCFHYDWQVCKRHRSGKDKKKILIHWIFHWKSYYSAFFHVNLLTNFDFKNSQLCLFLLTPHHHPSPKRKTLLIMISCTCNKDFLFQLRKILFFLNSLRFHVSYCFLLGIWIPIYILWK